jgi:hypothetical protein
MSGVAPTANIISYQVCWGVSTYWHIEQYSYSYTVQDPQGNRDKALIEVTISNNEVSPAQPAASNNSNGGGSMGGLVFLLILVVVIRRLTSSQLRQLC